MGHSPEPWRTYESGASETYAQVFVHPLGEDQDKIILTGPRARADAKRLVACVNAMRGIEDPEGWVERAKLLNW